MQFITTLFGASGGSLLNAAFSLGIVLTLVVLLLWVLKLISTHGTGVRRGQRRRLAVVESAVVDGKRRLLIVRRDNVEHVILTGGPQDVIIESGIPAPQPDPQPLSPHRTGPMRQPKDVSPQTPPTGGVTAGLSTGLTALAQDQVFPKRPQLRIDNSVEPEVDSANTASDGNSVAHADGTGRIGRLARRVRKGDA